ncbi:class I SAM-dependent methyltransferase [Paenibacillus sp. NPDC058071]|uniref:class I SAM-dependent methyltransferase n=1 Tax=Paenibacillus sp. NPDC058071 TaxID=3346326 RepID=UPI0036D88520
MLHATSALFFETERKLFFEFAETLGERDGTVVDVGCGNGAYLAKLHGAFPKLRMTGLEIDPAIYDIAAAREAPGLSFQLTSYEVSDVEVGSTGAVLARLVLQHIHDKRHFGIWACERLTANGRLIVVDIDEDALQLNERLPLFSQLYARSRSVLPSTGWLTFRDAVRLELMACGFAVEHTKRYSIAATTEETKQQLYHYMRCVSELYLGAPPPEEMEAEWSAWLDDPQASHEIYMFGHVFIKK